MPENISESINWASYLDAVPLSLIENVATERGYRPEFVAHLHAAEFLGRCPEGRYQGWRAFPIHDASGVVIAAHLVRRREKAFVYEPAGISSYPLVIGSLAVAATIHVFESQWDMLAVMDRLEVDPGGIPSGTAFASTRGAANVARLDGRLPAGATVLAWTQNDDAGDRWCHDLEVLCLRLGLRFGQLAPPPEYKDFNDLFRADPEAELYRVAKLEGWIDQAVQGACGVVHLDVPGDSGSPEEEPDAPPPPFPFHALPVAARDIIERGAAVMHVPPVLMAVCVLGALSAALGAGIAVQSALGRKSYGNLYILAAASSGAGKSEAARLIYAVIHTLETELIRAHEQGVAPHALARRATLTAKSKKLARAANGDVSEGEHDLSPSELELAGLQTELKEIEKKLIVPRLILGDATTEVIGVLLSKYRALASFSSDARDEISNVLGRYRDKGKTDEGLYIKMWSGDFHQVDRIGREPLRIDNARLSLLWLVQPDKLQEVVASESLWEGGLLPRMLLVQTGAQMQRIDPGSTATIPPEVKGAWEGLVGTILERYGQADEEREPVQPSPEASCIIATVHNEGVDQVQNGTMRDMDSFVARWAEQAWRFALILHVASHPSDAEAQPLVAETASSAAEIVRWFCLQQKRLLAQGREEKRRKKFERLVLILELAGNEETVRNLRDRHNWNEKELEILVAAFPTKIAFITRPPGSRGGRPSRTIKLM